MLHHGDVSSAKLAKEFGALVVARAEEQRPDSLVARYVAFETRRRGLPWDHQLVVRSLELGVLYRDHRYYADRPGGRTLAVAPSGQELPLPGNETELTRTAEAVAAIARNTKAPTSLTPQGRHTASVIVANLLAARYLARAHSLDCFEAVPENPLADPAARPVYLEALALVLLQDTEDEQLADLVGRAVKFLVNALGRKRRLTSQEREGMVAGVTAKYSVGPPDYLVTQPEDDLRRVWGKAMRHLKNRISNEHEAATLLLAREHDEGTSASTAEVGASGVPVTPGRTRRYRKQRGLPLDGPVSSGFCSRSGAARIISDQLGWQIQLTTLKRLESSNIIAPERAGRGVWYHHEDLLRALDVLSARHFSRAEAARMLSTELGSPVSPADLEQLEAEGAVAQKDEHGSVRYGYRDLAHALALLTAQ